MKLGLPGILFVIFLVLKLTGAISWSWFWVLSPLWVETVLLILVASVLYFLVY